MKFSIIVPVYNIDKYINECVTSLLNQTFKDFEIILVDDGSVDNSGQICDSFALSNDNIKVFHTINSGLSSARNTGVKNAIGDYIVFVDGDDYIDKNALKVFSQKLDRNYDLIITRLVEKYPDGEKPMDDNIASILDKSCDEQFYWLFNDAKTVWPAPKYIIRREFIIDNDFSFLDNYVHEDVDWTSRLFIKNPNTITCDTCWYYHRMNRVGSITTSIKIKNFIDVLNIASHFYDDFISCHNPRFDIIINRIMISVYGMINNYNVLNSYEKRELIKCIKNKKTIFKYAPALKYKLFVLTMRLLGPRIALKIASLF